MSEGPASALLTQCSWPHCAAALLPVLGLGEVSGDSGHGRWKKSGDLGAPAPGPEGCDHCAFGMFILNLPSFTVRSQKSLGSVGFGDGAGHVQTGRNCGVCESLSAKGTHDQCKGERMHPLWGQLSMWVFSPKRCTYLLTRQFISGSRSQGNNYKFTQGVCIRTLISAWFRVDTGPWEVGTCTRWRTWQPATLMDYQ